MYCLTLDPPIGTFELLYLAVTDWYYLVIFSYIYIITSDPRDKLNVSQVSVSQLYIIYRFIKIAIMFSCISVCDISSSRDFWEKFVTPANISYSSLSHFFRFFCYTCFILLSFYVEFSFFKVYVIAGQDLMHITMNSWYYGSLEPNFKCKPLKLDYYMIPIRNFISTLHIYIGMKFSVRNQGQISW